MKRDQDQILPESSVRADTAGVPAQRTGDHDMDAARRDRDGREAWSQRTRIVLTPVAAPSILGLFGFAGATFMVASLLAGWWGTPVTDAPIIAPFALVFGGLAQFMAAMWSYRARDGVATAMHGTWGAFWLAWGLLVLLTAGGMFPATVLASRALGFWFIVLSVVTLFGTLAALADNLALVVVLGLLTAGSILLAIGFVGGFSVVVVAGGWVLVVSAVAAFYTAGAMMLAEAATGRTILPLGTYNAAANIPGRKARDPIGYPGGMPGSTVSR